MDADIPFIVLSNIEAHVIACHARFCVFFRQADQDISESQVVVTNGKGLKCLSQLSVLCAIRCSFRVSQCTYLQAFNTLSK